MTPDGGPRSRALLAVSSSTENEGYDCSGRGNRCDYDERQPLPAGKSSFVFVVFSVYNLELTEHGKRIISASLLQNFVVDIIGVIGCDTLHKSIRGEPLVR